MPHRHRFIDIPHISYFIRLRDQPTTPIYNASRHHVMDSTLH